MRSAADYDVAASQRVFYRNRLMRVELRDAAGTEHVAQWFADTVRKWRVPSRERREHASAVTQASGASWSV